jgi:cytoskeletal protein CcmA (bactofilin family)
MFHRRSNPKDDVTLTRAETLSPRKIAPTIISADVRILGNVISDGMIDMNGRIEGDVKSEAVYVRENGMITGDITAATEVHVFGSVHGVIKSPKVCIYATGHIEGAIMHKSLSIEDGAYVDAQFKPFDAQPRLTGSTLSEHGSDTSDAEEEYNVFKELKLIS